MVSDPAGRPLQWAMAGVAAGVSVLVLWRRRITGAWRRPEVVAAEMQPDLLWEVTPDGNVTFASRSLADLLDHEPEALVGRHVSTMLVDDEGELTDGRSAASRSRSGWEPVRLLALDGTRHVREVSAVAFVNRRGRVVGYTGINRLLANETAHEQLAAKRRRLREVIRTAAVGIVAQPIVEIGTGRVIGVEMLSRFKEFGGDTEQWFIDAADVGLLQELELLAVDKALAAVSSIPDGVYVSINVSSSTLAAPELQRVLEDSAVDPARIVLELTEHDAITDYVPLQQALARLRGMGFRLAVDDAGAGYASFRHILETRPEFIKLDRAIVSQIHADAGRRALAAAIVTFALATNAEVVAEGVETAEEYELLATLGITAVQGYLLQRPTGDRTKWVAWRNPIVLKAIRANRLASARLPVDDGLRAVNADAAEEA